MRMQKYLRFCVAAAATVSLIAATQFGFAGSAAASGYHRHHGSSVHYSYGGYRPYYGSHHRYHHRHYGYRYSRHRHHGVGVGVHAHGSDAAIAVGVLGAGLLIGYLLTRPAKHSSDSTYRSSGGSPTANPSPTFGHGKKVARDCKPTTGTGERNGRLARFGGTFCYDANGQGYIVPGSEYLIGYLK